LYHCYLEPLLKGVVPLDNFLMQVHMSPLPSLFRYPRGFVAGFAIVLLLAGCASRTPAPVVDRSAGGIPTAVSVGPATPAPAPASTLPPPTAAVVDRGPVHVVQKGDTLIGIALAYGLDYRELAAWNSITNPNRIELGQELRITAPRVGIADAKPVNPATVATPVSGAGAVVPRPIDPATGAVSTAPVTAVPIGPTAPLVGAPVPGIAPNTAALKTEPKAVKLPYSDRALAQLDGTPEPTAVGVANPNAPPVPVAPEPPKTEPPRVAEAGALEWAWPAKGKVITNFTEATKGIDIAGKKGDPVLAAAAGRVMYSGTGVRGYGKLIIIKHDDTWVSAYAHNDQIMVKEQQDVRRGQQIATMGSTDTDKVKLHFEIRRKGKPVDPMGRLETKN
jgi:lipoprotein NlpD